LYKISNQKYKEFQVASNKITEILVQTVNKDYHSSIRDKPTLWEALRTLQRQCKPRPLTRKYHLLDRINQLKKAPNRANIEQWLGKWQGLFADATEINLPDIQDGSIQLDFLRAVKTINEPWATHEILEFRKADEDNQPSLLDLIIRYRESAEETETPKRKSYYAFTT